MKGLILATASLLLSSFLSAQEKEQSYISKCAEGKSQLWQQLAKVSVADIAEDDYDIVYAKIDIELNNTAPDAKGHVTTIAKVTAPALTRYVFELIDEYTVDSVFVDGAKLSFTTTNGLVREVQLLSALSTGTMFTTDVYYHGQNISTAGPSGKGLRTAIDPNYGESVTFTRCEPYYANRWWPCKQSLKDKIDSMDIWITVPGGLKAGSNGLLKNVTSLPGGFSRYEWKTNYPIDYYLVSIAVGNYVDYSKNVQFDNSTDIMPTQHYLYPAQVSSTNILAAIDSTNMAINYFSSIWGRYPFWKEKYGHCTIPLPTAATEHQTMTSTGSYDVSLLAHELSHQWFGDNVTCGTWKDIWLNEGVATYAEYLFTEHFRGQEAALNNIKSIHSGALVSKGAVYVDDTTSESRILNPQLTYNKGGSVLHMLRYVMQNDNLFFNLMKTYNEQYAYGNATTAQFQALAEQKLGRPLDTFFKQWIYGEGYPLHQAFWDQVNGHVYLKIVQTTSNAASVPLYYTPLEIKLRSPQGDTTFTIYNDRNEQYVDFMWSKTMNTVSIDPNDWLLNSVLIPQRDTKLSINKLSVSEALIYPNPATKEWTVQGLKAGASLQLVDMFGKILWQGISTAGSIKINARSLTAGNYILKIQAANGSVETKRLAKVE